MSNASDFEIKEGVLVKYNGTDEVVVVPDSVVEIGDAAFANNNILKEVLLPDLLLKIGGGAFYGCNQLGGISLPQGLCKIGRSAFMFTGLIRISLPDSLIEIEPATFSFCHQLQEVILPKGLRTIGEDAFGSTGIENINIPDSVVEIGRSAFYECKQLKEISLPDGLKRVGGMAFWECHSLRKITMPVGLEEFGSSAFSFPYSYNNLVERGYSLFYGIENIRKTLPDGSSRWITKINNGINDKEKIVAVINLAQIDNRPLRVFCLDKKNWKQTSDFSKMQSVIIPLTEKAIPVYDQLVAIGKIENISMYKSDQIYAALLRLSDSDFPVSDKLKPVFADLLEYNIDEAIECAEEKASPQFIQILIDISAINADNQSRIVKKLLKSPNQEINKYADLLSTIEKKESQIEIKVPPRPILRRLDTLMADELLKSHGIVSFPEVIMADGSGPAHVDFLKYILAEYVYNFDKRKVVKIEKADKVAELLDKESLQTALLTIYSDIQDIYDQLAILPVLFRYADGDAIRRIYPARATRQTWNDWLDSKDPASEALMLSETPEAAKYAEKVGLLGYYAAIQHSGKDYIRDQIRSLPEVEDINHSVYDFDKHCFVDAPNKDAINTISVETVNKYLNDIKKEFARIPMMELPMVLLADKTGFAPKEYLAFILLEYSFTYRHERPQFAGRAEEVARLLDRESLEDAVDYLYNNYLKTGLVDKFRCNIWPALFRFAKGSIVRVLYSLIKDEYWVRYVLLSDTCEAMVIVFTNKNEYVCMWQYALIRESTVEKIRDVMMTQIGLDENGIKTYDLGSGKVTLSLNSELKFELYDVKAGNAVKSIPKRNADPVKYEEAKQDYDNLKKIIKDLVLDRVNVLFNDFLEGSEYPVSEWNDLYLKNPVFTRVGRNIVWSQNTKSFMICEGGLIDCSGNPYELSDKPIVVAHPMEMTDFEIGRWQHYCAANWLKQPFRQIWEPVYDLKKIQTYRYFGCKIPLYCFCNQEKHGIEFSGSYDYSANIRFSDCGADVEYVEGDRYSLKSLYEIKNFEIYSPTRKANHIVGYLDRVAVIPRIRSDDVSVMEMMDIFSLAQIMEFITIAQEAQASNVLAALMEYKKNNYPDYDSINQICSLPEVEDINQSVYDFDKHCFVDTQNKEAINSISVEKVDRYLEETKDKMADFLKMELPVILLAGKTEPAPKEYLAFILSEYREDFNTQSPQFANRAEEVAMLLDRESLENAVEYLYRNYVESCSARDMRIWPTIFRFANGSVVREFFSGFKNYIEANYVLLSDTCEAMVIVYSNIYQIPDMNLWEYALIRETTIENIREIMMGKIGLDIDGIKKYDLGSGLVTVELNSELKFELYDEKAGKTVKSIPKRKADPEKYEAAKRDYDNLKKNIKDLTKSRVRILFKDFLDGHECPISEWRDLYLKNPVYNRVGRHVIWSQNKKAFILDENGLIDYSGKRYELSDEPIFVAHPMEMTNGEIDGWQRYFVTNGLKQPFQQIWEPVYDLSAIEKDRYDGCMIPLYCFNNQEKHGIEFRGSLKYEKVNIHFVNCGADVKYVEGDRYSLKSLYEIKNFEIYSPTRKANHIVGYLDRITIEKRVRSDDISVMQNIHRFTLAQIMEFIKAAQEAHASNVLAALMEYKNNKFPDFDPMSEFTLDM